MTILEAISAKCGWLKAKYGIDVLWENTNGLGSSLVLGNGKSAFYFHFDSRDLWLDAYALSYDSAIKIFLKPDVQVFPDLRAYSKNIYTIIQERSGGLEGKPRPISTDAEMKMTSQGLIDLLDQYAPDLLSGAQLNLDVDKW